LLSANSILEMEVDITTGGTAGYVFDRYDADNYKFVALDVANDQVIIGHATGDDGIVVDDSFAFDLDPAASHRLKVKMQGAGIGVSVDGTPVTSYGFNAALVDGGFGLVSFGGTAAFDDMAVRTNDAAFADPIAQSLMASTAAVTSGGNTAAMLSESELEPLVDEALRRWSMSQDAALVEALRGYQVRIADLPGLELGKLQDGVITLDSDAAGYGWFVDTTPRSDSEFRLVSDGALSAIGGAAAGRMDLLSALVHEFGHAAGFGHEDHGVMAETLDAGTRVVPDLKPWVIVGENQQDAASTADSPAQIDWLGIADLKPWLFVAESRRPVAPPTYDWLGTAGWRTNVPVKEKESRRPWYSSAEGSKSWKSRFVNELGAPAWSDSPNSRIQIHLPEEDGGATS